MLNRSFNAKQILLLPCIFTLNCPAANLDNPSLPPPPSRAHRDQVNPSRMLNAIHSFHERKEFIQHLFFRQRKKATELLTNSVALLTEGYNEAITEKVVHHVSKNDRCLGSLTDYALAAQLPWEMITQYDRNNDAAMKLKAEILKHLSEGSAPPQQSKLLFTKQR